MGMFDTVTLRCPRCEAFLEVQSKAGECVMQDFGPDSVPLKIAVDLEGDSVQCSGCRQTWVVVIRRTETVALRLIEP